MKKILFLLMLLFLFIPCIASAQLFDMGINAELGYLTEWECYSMNLDIALFINPNGMVRGVVYGGVEVLMDTNDVYFTFAPYQDTYKIGAAFHVNVFYVKGEHYCTHMVLSNWNQFYKRAYAENCTKFSVGWQVNMPYKVNRRGR